MLDNEGELLQISSGKSIVIRAIVVSLLVVGLRKEICGVEVEQSLVVAAPTGDPVHDIHDGIFVSLAAFYAQECPEFLEPVKHVFLTHPRSYPLVYQFGQTVMRIGVFREYPANFSLEFGVHLALALLNRVGSDGGFPIGGSNFENAGTIYYRSNLERAAVTQQQSMIGSGFAWATTQGEWAGRNDD